MQKDSRCNFFNSGNQTKGKETRAESPFTIYQGHIPGKSFKALASEPRNTESKSSCSNISSFLPSFFPSGKGLPESLLNYFEETKKESTRKKQNKLPFALQGGKNDLSGFDQERETKTDCRLFVCVRGGKCYLRSFDQELYSRGKKNAASMQLNKTKTRNQLPAAIQ
jgi:hypothetical protein